MDYAGLKALLTSPQYSGMTDAQIASAISTNNVTTYSTVPTAQWGAYMLSSGFMPALDAYANGKAPPGASAGAAAGAQMVGLLMASPIITHVDLAEPTTLALVQAMLGALVAEGAAGRLVSVSGKFFSQADMNALLNMGTSATCVAAQLGFSPTINGGPHDMVQEIAAARKWS